MGVGHTDYTSANEKQREHHQCLAKILREFREICHAGGFKATLGGRLVVLKFFIMYIIGNTEGHNDLALHMQKDSGCVECLCPKGRLFIVNYSDCQPRTMQHIVNARGNQAALTVLRQRHRVINVFWDLPLFDRQCGLFGICSKELLHMMDNGLFLHQVNALHDMLGEKDAGKKTKISRTNYSK